MGNAPPLARVPGVEDDAGPAPAPCAVPNADLVREPDRAGPPPEGPTWDPGADGSRRPLRLRAVLALLLVSLLLAGLASSTWPLDPATGPRPSADIPGVPSRSVRSVADVTSSLAGGTAVAVGSGIVLSADGEVLTNNHVIEGAESISVTDVGNGRTYRASVTGYDAADDLAVLQLSGASGLTTAMLGNSDAAGVGDPVIGLGNAGGAGGTPAVSRGRITALGAAITAVDDRTGSAEDLTGLIQTDAALQGGDSGGPLLDAGGQVIGINTAATAGFQLRFVSVAPAAFAIPLSRALAVVDQVRTGRPVAGIHLGSRG